MKALVVTCHDPFRPAHRRSTALVRRRRSLRNLAPKSRLPVICQLNGEWISRQAWQRKVHDGDCVVFITLPLGGGGGSNPLKIILMIAVAVAAPYLGSAILGIEGAAALGSFGVSLFNGAIGLVGSMLVNALIPAPKPSAARQMSAAGGGLAAPSPTYSIGAQGNAARLGQPIPVIYGRHLIYPDFAAMPYTEYSGNEQYLYQLFCLGQGEYDIEAIRIEDTSIASFPEISYEVVPPGGSVTLFPVSVTTSTEVAGQEALTSTTLGPFVANASGSVTNRLAVDVVMSRGLYYQNDSGGLTGMSITWTSEARLIDDVGSPLGSWFVLGYESYYAATTTPQRVSKSYGVASGRYEVRLTRTDTKQTDTRYGHELDWAGLRAYLPGTQTYGNVTMVAMRLRASNSLSSQAARKINFIVTRKLQTWEPGTGWSASTTPTRSIAWALADIARADYGAGLVDSRIDLQGLYDLDAVWTSRDDYFDAIFDTQSTIMESLSQTCRAGRAIPFVQGGIVHCVRDAAETIPAALFSQRNIVKNSLKLDYVMPTEDTSDAVDVTYFDAQIWGERTVRATLPAGTALQPAQVKLFGVTTRQQAWNEGMYIAACNRYRRRMLNFSTEMEGFIPILGDLIAVQHDMPRWGQSGEIVGWNAGTKIATLSEPLDWSAGGAHVLAFRQRDGTVAGPYATTAGVDDYHITLTDWTGSEPTPDIGGDRERSHYAFGPSNEQYIRCRVLNIKPASSETVEISAVVESDYVHTADTGTAPDATAWQLPSRFTSPVIAGLVARSMPDDPNVMVVTWQPAAGADHYLIEQSNGDDTWTRTGEVSAASFTAVALYGPQTIIRVAAVGLTRGPWVEVAYGQLASYFWTDDADDFWVTDSDLMWRY